MDKIIPIAIIVAIIVVLIGVFAFAQTNNQTTVNNSTSNNMDNMSNMNSTSSGNESPTNVIIENRTFNPSVLTIKPGTSVVWTVKEPTGKYMVTSNKTSNGMNLFMSKDLTNGQSFNYTFNQSGTFDYYDMDHMENKTLIGTIVVQ
jgi:plastocyanin